MDRIEFEEKAKELTKDLMESKKEEAEIFKKKSNPNLSWDQLGEIELSFYLAQTDTIQIEKSLENLRKEFLEPDEN